MGVIITGWMIDKSAVAGGRLSVVGTADPVSLGSIAGRMKCGRVGMIIRGGRACAIVHGRSRSSIWACSRVVFACEKDAGVLARWTTGRVGAMGHVESGLSWRWGDRRFLGTSSVPDWMTRELPADRCTLGNGIKSQLVPISTNRMGIQVMYIRVT